MKNEVSKREETRVLYEPPEPLFPDLPPKSPRVFWLRLAAFATLALIIIFVWITAVSAGNEENETQFTGTEPQNKTEITESERESTETEEPVDKETQTETNEELTAEQTENEIGTETDNTPQMDFVESDLSLAERGDAYIVNYTEKAVGIAELLDRGFVDCEEKNSPSPIVMILHTHTSEAYYKSENKYLGGVISVGDALSRRLNALGLTAIHCTVIHDDGEGNAYIAAGETIKMMLKVYPSIKYVIDLHRMELESDGVPVKTVSTEGLAQIRLTVSADGAGWQENLSLALSVRQKLNENGTRLCMPPTLSPSRYNSDLPEYYLMVDVGATGNTVREATFAAERLAEAIYDTVIKR
ncbi:MAG: stage II sporulation protein P [Clostridia bacterium]|nr:stage II sporulation protein P [Clostridia bacterium]